MNDTGRPDPIVEFATVATSYGTGPFHPAIRNGKRVLYWPNITKATEDEAYEFAAKALEDAYGAACEVADNWNVYQA